MTLIERSAAAPSSSGRAVSLASVSALGIALSFVLVFVLGLASAPSASAATRSVVIEDREDPGVGIDVKRAAVSYDTAAGSVNVQVELWRPMPAPGDYVGERAKHAPTLDLEIGRDGQACVSGKGTAMSATAPGDLEYISVYADRATQDDPATGQPVYRYVADIGFPDHDRLKTTPVTVSDDGLELVFSFADPLLVKGKLRCVAGRGSGNAAGTPATPGGDVVTERGWTGWFDGYRQPLHLRLRGGGTQAFATGARATNLRHELYCTFLCKLKVRGRAETPKGTPIRGLNVSATFDGGRIWIPGGYRFTAKQQRLMTSAIRRHGRVIYRLEVEATAEDGRTKTNSRRFTLVARR